MTERETGSRTRSVSENSPDQMNSTLDSSNPLDLNAPPLIHDEFAPSSRPPFCVPDTVQTIQPRILRSQAHTDDERFKRDAFIQEVAELQAEVLLFESSAEQATTIEAVVSEQLRLRTKVDLLAKRSLITRVDIGAYGDIREHLPALDRIKESILQGWNLCKLEEYPQGVRLHNPGWI